MEESLNKNTQRNLTGSLEQCQDELRDAYMSFKDLQTRCTVQIKQQNSTSEDHPVFYFKPDTFLLDEPDKQRQYRAELLKKVGNILKPDPITYLGDELHRSMCQIVADRSTPKATKQLLCEFFKRRQYALQHMKYKLLCRWAHHNLTSETAENISHEATFMYGKLEFNLEQSILRQDRLEQEDYYDRAIPENRPSTRSQKIEGGSLYVEKFDLLPQSLVREDDIEVYMRGFAYKNKLTKVVNKFISRLKWLPSLQKFKVFENSINGYFNQKQKNIDKQKQLLAKAKERALKSVIMTPELQVDLDEIMDSHYCQQYEKMFLNQIDKIMHQWKANHDEVPSLIFDPFLLEIKILDHAQKLGLTGDIELDNGFAFSYQVTVFFPGYFQTQVLKSQFSIYDPYTEDQNNMSKRTLIGMTRIDTNIFRDVSTTKHTVPSDEVIATELKGSDLKVIRLKSASFWVDYVVLSPSEPDWHHKQQAVLNESPIDSVLKQAFNFIDLNDLASINKVNEENTQSHIKNMQKLFENTQMQKKTVETSDGSKYIQIDKRPHLSNIAGNLEQHVLKTVADNSEDILPPKRLNKLSNLPGHLLTSYYTLRFIKSRDAKTRILYTLNYFRSIQKRLALDLREFATRDRIDAHFVNPFIQAKEANQHILNNVNVTSKIIEKVQKNQENPINLVSLSEKMSVFDHKAIQSMKNMASVRQYKQNGLFNSKVFSTCPSFPKYHASHGEPITTQHEEIDKNEDLTSSSIKLMGRIDFVEINENLQEVYIKDDFGIYILWDCALQDMKCLEEELCKIGSCYLSKAELLIDPTDSKSRSIQRDRLEILHDLLVYEAEFQFHKVKLCQVYMECYEHITDPLEQHKIQQIITDIMSRRPRLNLSAHYFQDAYETEIQLLKKQFELAQFLVDTQISLEKTENKRLQDSLNLSYFLANKYSQNKWQYQDQDELLKVFLDKKYKKVVQKKQESSVETFQSKQDQEASNKEAKQSGSLIFWGDESDVSLDNEDFLKDEQNKFANLLGLPQISLESIYQTYHEKDVNILKVMSEHSNFIQCHEGYPEFLTKLRTKSIIDKNLCFKPNKWSQDTGALDFYETLDFITKFYSVTQSAQQELYDSLKMWDPTLLTQIDIQFTEMSLQEFRRVIQFQENSLVEYEGRNLIEDEQVLGSSDKMIFYAKEMISDLTKKPKVLLDPFIIQKLDLSTITNFEFPKIQKEFNKYTLRSNGIAGAQYLMQVEKQSIEGIAKTKHKEIQNQMENFLQGKVDDPMNTRNVVVPTMFKTYCNMMELCRLRQEIILNATETSILSQVYLQQCEIVGLKLPKVVHQECIQFLLSDYQEQNLVDYLDHGPSHSNRIELAINEFDTNLLSNVNFRNPDSFKMNILTSGLEEVRAILQYQVLQKHLLIVATRLNQILIDSHEQVICELNLIQSKKIAIPNSIVRYQRIINKLTDSLNISQIKQELQTVKLSLSSNCMPVFYNIINKKSSQRTSLAKEFSLYHTSVVATMTPIDNEQVVNRIMRNYKLKLLTRFVQNTCNEVYLDAQKIQAIQTCQRLRIFNRYFSFDSKQMGMDESAQLFKYETSQFIENFTSNYLPEQFSAEEQSGYGVKKQEIYKAITNYQIVDYTVIPSTTTLLALESSSNDEIVNFKRKRLELRAKIIGVEIKDDLKEFDKNIIDPERVLKQLLPTFNPESISELQYKFKNEDQDKKKIGQQLDYEEALYYGDSKYASLVRYYQQMERIITVEWFLCKLQFRASEVVQVDSAMESGLLFWKPDVFEERVSSEIKPAQRPQKNNKTYDFIQDKISFLRQKQNIAEGVNNMSQTLKSFIKEYLKTKQEHKFEYISQYSEFRYQQVLGSLHKLVQQFYISKNITSAQIIRQSISCITKMGHSRALCQLNQIYVQNAIVQPEAQSLESGSLIQGVIQHDAVLNFKRCIQPVINERALEPPQITLFQSLYQSDNFRRLFPSQFAGQTLQPPFKAMDYALLKLPYEDRQYSQSFVASFKNLASDFLEQVFNDTKLSQQNKTDVYSLSQLLDAKKFINEATQALLLRNALMCWFENSPLPETVEIYDKFEQNFRNNFFWRQIEQKEQLTKKLSMQNMFGQIPSQKDLKKLRENIEKLQSDQTLATENEVLKRDQLVKALREEFAILKKKVTLDNYFNIKAEILVFSSEIEKFMIRASVRTLDSECAAIAKCFTLQIPKIQYHIHPFQQFAATLYDQVDPNMHLDVSNRIAHVQVLLTKMRNRSTEVETLTSGPGMVITIKDINDILQEFCRSTIKDQEKQFKSRSETSHLIEDNYRVLLYSKDQQVKQLEHRINNIALNLENIIDSRLFEKGNQLIYELDASNRIVSLFKSQLSSIELRLQKTILDEHMQKFKRQNNLIDLKNAKFSQYKQTIQSMINADWAEDMERINTQLKQKAENAKTTDGTSISKRVQMYPLTQVEESVNGAVLPSGFLHYPSCKCYVPNPNHPRPLLEYAELQIMSEREARDELLRMCQLVRKQRVLFRTKEMLQKTKYQDQINLLKKQQNSNQTLWDQFGETEKRERVLRQELIYTQQQLSSSENTIASLKDQIKSVDAERVRLLNFKTSQYDRLKELEVKVHKYDIADKIDTDKLVVQLSKNDRELNVMKKQTLYNSQIVETQEARRVADLHQMQAKFRQEQMKTQKLVDQMEQMKQELNLFDQTPAAQIWRKKLVDVFDICQQLKNENEELRDKCKELIQQGVDLAEAIFRAENQSSLQSLTNTLNKPDSQFIMNQKLAQNQMRQTLNSLKKNQICSSINSKATKQSDNQQRQSSSIDSSLQPLKQIPMTQQRNRTINQGFDYSNISNKKNDIKSVLTGPQSIIDSQHSRKFASTDQPFRQNVTSHKQNRVDQIEQYGNTQVKIDKLSNIILDLKGNQISQQAVGSPRTRLLQQSRKQNRQMKQNQEIQLYDDNLILNE